MKRLFPLLTTVFVLAGCAGQAPPAADPFFGQTRVPPPGTGAISGGTADPYYNGQSYPPGSSTAPPRVVIPEGPPGTTAQPPASGGSNRYTPPGGSLDYRGSSLTGPRNSVATRPQTRVPAPAFSTRSQGVAAKSTPKLAGREPVIQILQPRPKTAARPSATRPSGSALASTSGEPRRLNVPKGAVEITDLPKAGSLNTASRPESASGPGGVRLVSGTEGPDDSGEVTAAGGSAGAPGDGTAAAEFAPQGTYGHDPEYRWLRGKLEYSQIDRRWKLRYIPIDGATDEFGGSVVLPDPKLLAGCERGDFVEVRGKLGQRDEKKGFAPSYEAAEVKRLGQGTP